MTLILEIPRLRCFAGTFVLHMNISAEISHYQAANPLAAMPATPLNNRNTNTRGNRNFRHK